MIDKLLLRIHRGIKGNFGLFLRYSFAVLVALIALLPHLFFQQIISLQTTYLLLVIAITSSSWYGGLRVGLITFLTSIIATGYLFLSYSHLQGSTYLGSLLEYVLFASSGILINFAIESYRRTDMLAKYKSKEFEFIRHIETLRDEMVKAQEEIRVRDEFLSIASHELKTPLTSMLLKLQTILHNIRNVSLANFSVGNLLKMLESAEQQSQRLSKMINDLLNVSLIRTGKMDLELEEADLSMIVKNVIEGFSEKAEKERYRISFASDSSVLGKIDKLRVEQAVTNLISNAIKYGNGKPIDVKVSKKDSIGEITITDHGIGISKENQEKIFDLFERGVSHNAYKGLGVGLYITRQIVRAHKGIITVESKQGQGSTFTIELPLNQPANK